MNRKPYRSAVFLLLLAISGAWGYQGHQKISGGINILLPVTMSFLSPVWTAVVIVHASDADYRKDTVPGEAPRHYIDIDNYPEFLLNGRIHHNLDSLIAMHGYDFVYEQGLIPWATMSSFDSLVSCFQRRDWNKAGLFAADLGHYVGDGHMPLHLTKNYDGQYTGQNGVHSRYETKMINRYVSGISILHDTILFIDNVQEYIFNYIYENYRYADSVLIADDYASTVAGSASSNLYYETLWNAASGFTGRLFQGAAISLTELVYTAWVTAGRPVMDPNAIPEYRETITARICQNHPNPFNNITYIPIEITRPDTRVTLEVFNSSGNRMVVLFNGLMHPGLYKIPWEPGTLPSGIYYCILRTDKESMAEKMIFLN